MAFRLLFCFLATLMPLLAQAEPIRFGSVVDGPSVSLDEGRRMVEQEIVDLLVPEQTPEFPDEYALVANWTLDGAKGLIQELLNDPDVDIILAIGLLASEAAAQLPELTKPVIASSLIDADKETPENLSYVQLDTNIVKDLEFFQQIACIDQLVILFDQQLLDELDLSPNLDIPMQTLAVNSADQVLATLPQNTNAVYVTYLPQLSRAEMDKLYAGLAKRKIATFSMKGEEEVKRGALAGLAPERDKDRLARRLALNVQRVLMGEKPETIPVELGISSRLSFNKGTADQIGLSPSWELMQEATVYGERETSPPFSLREALEFACSINPQILVAYYASRAQYDQARLARSRLLPQVGLGAEARLIDKARAREGFGRSPQRLVRGGIAVRQNIYSDQLLADAEVAKYRYWASRADLHTISLDILLDVGTTYVDLLRRKTLLQIENNNLKLTRANLELAESRVEIGTSRKNEVYRWESQAATNKEAVVRSAAQVRVAEAELNRLLHRPSLCPIHTAENTLSDLMPTLGQQKLTPYISTPQSFEWFTEFEICRAWQNAPELQSIDASIRARYRRLVEAKRGFYLPEFELFGDSEQRFVRGGTGVNPPQIPSFTSVLGTKAAVNDWMVGIRATFPLFEGGGKFARLSRDRNRLKELCNAFQREADSVSNRMTSSLDLALSSFLSIDLASDAVITAQKNLDFVFDAYARGAASILDLLDAQQQLLTAQRDEANAQFDFATDLLRVMRAAGKFDFFLSEQQRECYFQALQQFFAQKQQQWCPVP